MGDEVLLRFLEKGLLDVGGDDAKLGKLQSTAEELAASLGASPGKTARFAMVAVDPDVPEADPTVTEVVKTLRSKWPTYVNTFARTPLLLVRAILLDALAQAAADDRIGVAFVASVRNCLPFMDVGDEREIWAEAVTEVEARIDSRAEAEWATPGSIALPRLVCEGFEAAAPGLKHQVVNRATLASRLQAAAGPNGMHGATGGNPAFPAQQPQQWVTEFGKRAAEAISDAIDAVAESSTIDDVDISGPLESVTETVTQHVEAALAAFAGAAAGLQRRTNLLWWKEAAFSPSARVSYRDMTPESAAALMARDLHDQVPTFSPASVAAFLRETVSTLADVPPRPIGELAAAISRSVELAPLRATASALFETPRGRAPLLAWIAHSQAPVPEGEFRDKVGVDFGSTLDMPTWAAWLFRELQAARATAEGA